MSVLSLFMLVLSIILILQIFCNNLSGLFLIRSLLSACLPCKTRRYCHHGVIVIRKTCYRLYAGSCHAVSRVRRHIVPCPRKRRVVRRCKGCKGLLVEQLNVRVGCHCRRRRRTRPILCCCPPPRRHVICVNPFLQTIVTGFVLNRSRTKCLRIIVQRSLRVRRKLNSWVFVS